VLGVPIDIVSSAEAVDRVQRWAARGESRVVCICNVHSVITARQQPEFLAAVAGADLATPDGAPVAWMLRRLGVHGQQRVSGPDLMLDYCAAAAVTSEPVFLLGSTQRTLELLQARLVTRFPGLRIAGSLSPPFRPLTAEDDERIAAAIAASGARTVWVSLGCPKQELWMSRQRGRIPAPMIGVGAAFDFHAGTVRRAPGWMQRSGLEWLHRLLSEPRRLWRRYLVTNTAFVLGALRQIVRGR
jgi:N-acetylglucosaminyldiphosphoundecaprenol N-acetyl-beta-D-mannosaminyltransferase